MPVSLNGRAHHGNPSFEAACGLLVPTLCVGTIVGRSASRLTPGRDAERPSAGSHAERGSQEKR
jgi:hypothetical protein